MAAGPGSARTAPPGASSDEHPTRALIRRGSLIGATKRPSTSHLSFQHSAHRLVWISHEDGDPGSICTRMSAALRIIFCAAFTSAFVTPAVPHRAVMPQHPARRAVPKAYTPDLDATIDGIDVTSLSTPSLPQVISIRGGGNLSPSAVTALGAVVNVMLSLLKLFVGTASGSAALVADAYHSGSDLLVDAVTMLAVHAPPSFERAATLVIAGLLSTAGVAMMWSAGLSLWRRSAPVAVLGTPPLLVALVAIACKEALFRITRAVARRTRQQVLLASAKHHRSDAMSSLAAAVGAVGVLVGLPLADTLAAAAVGGMMVSMGVSVAIGEQQEH